MHGEHDAEGFEFAPERIELGQRRIAAVPEARAHGGRLEPLLRHATQLGDRVLDALDRQHRARKEAAAVGGRVVIDPVVVRGGQHARGLGIAHQRQPHEPRREQHHLVGAERVHVAQPRVRIAASLQPAEAGVPRVGAGREPADLLLAPAWPADLRRVGALARGRHGAAVDQERVGVGVEVELRLRPRADTRRHVLVPDRRRLDDVAVAIEHGEGFRRHRRLLSGPYGTLAGRRLS